LADKAAFIDRYDITDHTEPAERMDSVELKDPTEKIEKKEPIEPTEHTEPTEPSERTEPFEPTDSTEFWDHNEYRDLDCLSCSMVPLSQVVGR
jgi:hypothetical protein